MVPMLAQASGMAGGNRDRSDYGPCPRWAAMPTGEAFDADGVTIAYDDRGTGDPVVLVHGFASSRVGNWREQGWYDRLSEAGRRVVALDCRGHGDSDTPHDSRAYRPETMVGDVVGLLDHLGIPAADLVGYSMGARIGMHLLVTRPDRVDAAVLAGVGGHTLRRDRYSDAIPGALEADDPTEIEDETARGFREFAAGRGNDLRALAACRRARQPGLTLTREDLAAIDRPVLVVAGAEDELVGDPGDLAAAIPGGRAVAVPDRDHLTTVGDPRVGNVVVSFLARAGLA